MEQRGTESGSELVLDNRKLIIAFLFLMILCGAFFIIGFMEGKRQGLQANLESIPVETAESIAESTAAENTTSPAKAEGSAATSDRSVREQLDWYKKVNQPNQPEAKLDKPVKKEIPSSPSTADRRPSKAAPKASARKPSTTSPTSVYRVQVGAFKQGGQAEKLAAELQEKGYPCVVEAPGPENELFLVKVGKFDTRANAVAMQLRLKKDGYSSFIKTK